MRWQLNHFIVSPLLTFAYITLSGIVSVCTSVGILEASAGKEFKKTVDEIVHPYVDNSEWCVGLSIGILKGGNISYFSYGKRDINKDGSPDENTLYEIASLTKLFTALLLAEAEQNGEVKLDDSLRKHLVLVPTHTSKNGSDIRLIDLATHTSGLPENQDSIKLYSTSQRNPFKKKDIKTLYDFISKLDLVRIPGKKYVYSNIGMGLLGHVLAKRTDLGYERYIVERLFKPLRMNNTKIVPGPKEEGLLATGHDADGNIVLSNWFSPGLEGCGALRSNVMDMMKYVKINVYPEESKLSSSIIKAQQVHFKVDEKMLIGLGWIILPQLEILAHSGCVEGFSSFVGISLKNKTGVVVLSNSTGIPFSIVHPAADIGYTILDILNDKPIKTPILKKTRQVSSEILDRYVGEYELGQDFFVTILREGQHLVWLQTGDPKKYGLYPETKENFFFKVSNSQVSFVKDQNEDVIHFLLNAGDTELKADRILD